MKARIYEGLRIDKGPIEADIEFNKNSISINGENFPIKQFLKILAVNLGYDLSDEKVYRDNYTYKEKILIIRTSGEIMYCLWGKRWPRSFSPSFRIKKPLQKRLFKSMCKFMGYTLR